MFSCLQILEAFLWFVLITLLNVTLIILTLSVSRLLNLLLRLVAFLLFLNPQCLASISRWITASSSWKRFCLFVCRALSSIMVIRQNLCQELDAVIHLLMEAKHWGLRKSRNATSLNSRFKSLDTLKVKIISVTFRRVIRTNHKKASKIWRHENIQLGGCQS